MPASQNRSQKSPSANVRACWEQVHSDTGLPRSLMTGNLNVTGGELASGKEISPRNKL